MHWPYYPLPSVLFVLSVLPLCPTAAAPQLVLTATLEPAQSTAVYAAISGTVQRVTVQEGDTVVVGAPLALLESTELRLIERSACIAYQKAQNQLSRAEALHVKGGISTQTLESLQYDSEQARIRWQRAQLDLNRTTILTPTAGIIAECHTRASDITSPRLHLFTIINSDTLKVMLFIPADQLADICLNQPITASPIADSSQAISGIITHISPVIDPESGTCKAIAVFPNTSNTIKPGTVARVQINERQKEP